MQQAKSIKFYDLRTVKKIKTVKALFESETNFFDLQK